jgi:pyridoxamine 5'-phosphate oxidase
VKKVSPFKGIDNLHQAREEYGTLSLLEAEMDPDPIMQFKLWFELHAQLEPKTYNAMVLSTVDEQNHPDSRVVLLKEVDAGEFVFYTQYISTKGQQLQHNPWVALNFYWSHHIRQIRIRGKARRVSAAQSDEYFYSRPLASQCSSIASVQSQVIPNQDTLTTAYQRVCAEHQTQQSIVRPESWGGYAVEPYQIEFWQGRDNRLHDRIQYIKQEPGWLMQRLAP